MKSLLNIRILSVFVQNVLLPNIPDLHVFLALQVNSLKRFISRLLFGLVSEYHYYYPFSFPHNLIRHFPQVACGDFFLVSECNISFNELDGQKIHLLIDSIPNFFVNILLIWFGGALREVFKKEQREKVCPQDKPPPLHQFVLTFKIKLPPSLFFEMSHTWNLKLFLPFLSWYFILGMRQKRSKRILTYRFISCSKIMFDRVTFQTISHNKCTMRKL